MKSKFIKFFTALWVLILFLGCGDDPPAGGGQQGGTIPPGGNITPPSNPPAVSGGNFSSSREYDLYENELVTSKEQLKHFLELYMEALTGDRIFVDSKNRSLRQDPTTTGRPAQYGKGSEQYKDNYIVHDKDKKGRVEIKEDGSGSWSETVSNDSDKWFMTATLKYFDYSNGDSLFLAGSVGYLEIEEYSWLETGVDVRLTEKEEYKINGTIMFKGRYEGKLVFQQFVLTRLETNMGETVTSSGNIFVTDMAGGNRQDVDFDYNYYDVRDLIWPDYYYYGDWTYPNSNIQSPPTMPAVPAAPSGSLNQSREGINAPVTNDNLNAFLKAFHTEFSNFYYDFASASTRASTRMYEESGAYENLKHGRTSGYITEKGSGTYKENNENMVSYGSGTSAFFDFSSMGHLFLGGGVGGAHIMYFDQFGDDIEENVGNGTLNFNGTFKGTIVFNHFRYKVLNWRTVEYVSGTVTVAGLNITEKYVEYMNGGGFDPDPDPDPDPWDPYDPYDPNDPIESSIIGSWIGEDSYGDPIEITFNSNGTGTLFDIYEDDTLNFYWAVGSNMGTKIITIADSETEETMFSFVYIEDSFYFEIDGNYFYRYVY